MRRLLAFVALTLGALLLVESVNRAADTPVVVKGRVSDENGLPVGGAQVKLELPSGQGFAAVTDDAGFCTFANIPPDEYTVRIE